MKRLALALAIAACSAEASVTGDPPLPGVAAPDPVLAAVNECLGRLDLKCAHRVLEPIVVGKRAGTPLEAQVLYDVCDYDVDLECIANVVKAAPKVDRRPNRTRSFPLPEDSEDTGTLAPEGHTLLLADPDSTRVLLQARVAGPTASHNVEQ